MNFENLSKLPVNPIINPTFGTDPEFAIIEKESGEFISGVGIVGGNKHEPMDLGKGCSRHSDNVAAEFNIPPVDTKKDFLDYIQYCQQRMQQYLDEFFPGLLLIPASSGRYNIEQLQSYEAMSFGCSPSMDAYTGEQVYVECDPENNLRTFGFHVHIGFKGKVTESDLRKLAIIMDVMIGIPAVIIDRDTERRHLYGKAGDYRFRVLETDEEEINLFEYRSLGGNMLMSKETIEFVYDQTIKAIQFYNHNGFESIFDDIHMVPDIMNDNNITLANKFIEKYKSTFYQNLPKIKIEEYVN